MTEKLSTIFNNTARSHPDNIAVVYHENESTYKQFTYKQLQDESMNIARFISENYVSTNIETPALNSDDLKNHLIDKHINVPDNANNKDNISVIAILCHPGPSAIACILGVLQCNAYFYISPDSTKTELMTYLNRVRPEFILIEDSLSIHFNLDAILFDNNFIVFGKKFKLSSLKISWNDVTKCTNNDLAYVITTSGSTGTPKLVYVPHKCIVPNISDFVDIFRIDSEDCIFCAAPLTFDPSVVDLFMAFKTGAKLIMVPPTVLKMPNNLFDIIIKNKITVLQATPTLVMSLKTKMDTVIHGLRILALGGEQFPKLSVLKNWLGTDNKTRIFNIYGITEVSCWASLVEVTRNFLLENQVAACQNNIENIHQTCNLIETMIPIGKPLSFTDLKVLNTNFEEMAEGEEGEIFIGGTERVCRVDDEYSHPSSSISADNSHIGNIGNRESEAKQIWRHTGDLGILKNGNIYCLGRFDSIVKRNGQKVSLPEITRACEALSYVEKSTTIGANGKIIAFICPQYSHLVSEEIIRTDLKGLLSYWKMPDEFIILKDIPFNSHGKISKEMLLQERCLQAKTNVKSLDSLENILETFWKRKLGVRNIKDEDNFINCGGDSLTAVQLVEELEKHIAYEVPELLDVVLNNSFENILKHLIQSHIMFNDEDQYPKEVKMPRIDESNDNSYCQYTTASTNKILNSLEYNPMEKQASKPIKMSISRRGFYKHGSLQCVNSLLPQSADLSWKFDLGKCIDSSPLLVEYDNEQTFLFVGSHSHKFICIDALTGTVHWCIMLADRIESSPNISEDGGCVYVGCYSGDLYCIKVDNGNILWRYETGDVIKCSPVIDSSTGYVMVGSHDKNLYCLDKEGKLIWKKTIGKGSIFSSPCIKGHLVFAATLDGIVAGININTGNIIWTDNVNKPIFSSLAMYSEGIVFGSVVGDIYGYSFTGSRLWMYTTGGRIFSSPFVLKLDIGEEIIAIGCHNNNVYFLNGKGEMISVYNGNSPIYSTPFLYITSEYNLVSVLCETSGRVSFLKMNAYDSDFKLNLSSKDKKCPTVKSLLEITLPGELFSSPVIYRDKIYICSRDNFIYCFDLKTS